MGSRRPRCSADTRSETPAIRNDTDSIQRDLDPEKTSDRELGTEGEAGKRVSAPKSYLRDFMVRVP